MGRFSIQRPSVWGFASSKGRIADFSFFLFFLRQYNFRAKSPNPEQVHLLGHHRRTVLQPPCKWTTQVPQLQNKDTRKEMLFVCFQWFDQTFLFFFCFYLISSQQIPPDVPAPPSSFPGQLNIVAPPLSFFNPEKVETWNLSLVSVSTDPADGTVSADALDWTAGGTCQSVTRADEAAPWPPPGWAIESFGLVDASSSVSDRNSRSEHTHTNPQTA